MHVVMAEIRVKPEHREAFVRGLREDARLSLADTEPRCYRFDVFADAADPCLIYTCEAYPTRADHEQLHRSKPYFLALMQPAREGQWFAAPPVIRTGRNVLPTDAKWEASS